MEPEITMQKGKVTPMKINKQIAWVFYINAANGTKQLERCFSICFQC